ncbi:MAG: hypothetical protein AAGI38_00765, partial [Bacteroidota bacterium]
MLRKIDLLLPGFLKRLDRYLLLNRPALWATKVHYALFFVMIGYALMGLHLAVNPIQPYDVPESGLYFGLLMIPAGLSFLWYTYQVSLFKVEKHSGQRNNAQNLRDQVVYFFIILLIAAGPIAYTGVHNSMVANKVTTSELESDLNALEIGDLFFPTNTYIFEPLNLTPDGKVIFDGDYHYNYGYSRSGVEVIATDELIELHTSPTTHAVKLEMIDRYMDVLEKYADYRIPYTSQKVLASFESKEMLFAHGDLRQMKGEASKNISRILNAKRQISSNDLSEAFQFFFIFISCAWLLFMVFQQMNLKLYLFMAVTGFLAMLASGFSIAALHELVGFRHEESLVLVFYFGFLTFLLGIGYH